MAEPHYKLGQPVFLTPVEDPHARKGLVIGITKYANGSFTYVVSVADHAGVARHTVMEEELQPVFRETKISK